MNFQLSRFDYPQPSFAFTFSFVEIVSRLTITRKRGRMLYERFQWRFLLMYYEQYFILFKFQRRERKHLGMSFSWELFDNFEVELRSS